MRKLVSLYIACAVLLTACIETLTSTDIKADGSGSMTATVDLSEIMKMMAEGKTNGGELKIDTTMFMRDHADTSPLLSAYQKKLVHDMKMRMIMNLSAAEEFKFIMTITVPFKSLDDFNALNELMKQDEYDKVFDKAMEIPMFSDKNNEEEKAAGGNDNPFGSLFPSFYNCIYKKNSIECKLDSAKYRQSMADLKKNQFDINGDMESKMFEAAIFTNKLSLPASPKNIKGESWKQGATEKELVQMGNLLELYKHPEKYEYTIQY